MAPTTGTKTTSTTGSHPLSKAAYEAKLGPMLNARVVPALKGALSDGGVTDPQKLKAAAGLLDQARSAMGSLTPPTKVADLNREAVTRLGAPAANLTKMSEALHAHNQGAYLNAAQAAMRNAGKVETIGGQFSARGY
ncbi:MAG: hypothetical protein JO342_03755 [Solirubrobacterales bacterium]|nr:hypothetical protein [Solirubrobacterales bacterium]MBV9165251.1 hypothetical protein [Solirubrobacterales bacterium]